MLCRSALALRSLNVFLQAGSYLFRGKFPPKDFYSDLDLSADALDDESSPAVEGKAGTPVTAVEKALLQDLSPWLTQPDYDRVSWGSCLQFIPYLVGRSGASWLS